MKIHRLAKYFPIIEGEEFDRLVEDIRENGQMEPIMLVGEEILDGVNRARACEKLGVEPKTKQFSGKDPLKYVISENVRRRHLNQSQKAALAVELLPEFQPSAAERMMAGRGTAAGSDLARVSDGGAPASAQAARAVGASGRSVEQAKRVKAADKKLFEQVVKGDISVDKADLEVSIKKSREIEDAKTGKTIHREVSPMVKEFCNLIDTAKEVLRKAIIAKRKAALSPEGIRFIDNKLDQIEALINDWREAE
jgi:ParB-like chromosome segregation protein Spo0J